MIRNFLSVTFRNIARNKVYTMINVLGLAMGITVAILIFLIVSYDLDFDNFHLNDDRIFRVVHTEENSGALSYHANIPYPAGKDLSQVINGVEIFTQIHQDERGMLEINGQKAYEDGVLFVDSSFFHVFNFEVLAGNPQESFKKINTTFITESLAVKYFGSTQQAIGQQIRMANLLDLEVTGIVADPPSTSHLQFQLLVSYPSLSDEYVGGFPIDNWGVSLSGYLYVLLADHVGKTQVEDQITNYRMEQTVEEESNASFYLQPLKEIHFDMDYARFEFSPTVDKSYLYILSLIGFFITLIASINFINLSTALSVRRSKEVGIKKSLGASRTQLVIQFILETLLIVLVSILLSMGLVERLLPVVSSFLEKDLSFNLLSDPRIILFLLALLVTITMLAGLYPAFVASRFTPIKALQVKTSVPSRSISTRRVLVIFQFIISQGLVIGSIIIISQLKYFQSKPLGFDQKNIVLMELFERDSTSLTLLQERMTANPHVQSVSFGTGVPTSRNSIGTSMRRIEWDENQFIRTRIKAVDYKYLETFDLKLAVGEWIKDGQRAEDGIVINEQAARQLGFDSPHDALGQVVQLGVKGTRGPVIGVLKDFHSHTLHRSIGPLAVFPMHQLYYEAGIKIDSDELESTMKFIVDQWEATFPGYIYEYEFMDEMIASMYGEERKILAIANIAAIFSIFIGCLGLYGLVSFMVIQRNKEIGIRKAVGASSRHIVVKFSSEFIILLTVSFGLAAPIVWFIMDQWLQEFAYHIQISPLVFLLGYGGSILVAGLTVGYKSLMAARINPVEALKEE